MVGQYRCYTSSNLHKNGDRKSLNLPICMAMIQISLISKELFEHWKWQFKYWVSYSSHDDCVWEENTHQWMYEIFSSILCERLKTYLKMIGSYQCCFRPGESTLDQIFRLRRPFEKPSNFESISTINSLFTSMRYFGIPPSNASKHCHCCQNWQRNIRVIHHHERRYIILWLLQSLPGKDYL